MLVIRDEQWRAFEEDVPARVEDRLVRAVLDAWPEACAPLGRSGTRARVRRALERARELGFEGFEERARFVHLDFLAGQGFERETKWGRSIMGWDADARTKLAALERAAAEA
ncbi:MAG: hypothetical protein D6731_04760 [Planctomycetota bacterium]|nr:MAG: hypothetical protein D6731_04760 [Planctomycetota bacterium]